MRSVLDWLLPAALIFTVTASVGMFLFPKMVPDSEHYIAVAQLAPAVPRPWGSRVLHPLAARALSLSTGWSLERAFRVLTLGGLFVFVAGVAWLNHGAGRSAWWAAASVFGVTAQAAAAIFLNEIFFLAVIMLFLIALRKKAYPSAFILSLTLPLVREIGILIVLSGAAVLLMQRRARVAFSLVGACLVSWFAILPLVAPPGTNIHLLPTSVYLSVRTLTSSVRNFLGFQVWTNTLADWWSIPGRGGCQEPIWSLELPSFLRMGNVHQVGLCPWDPGHIAVFAAVYATALGLLPGFMWRLRCDLARLARTGEIEVRTCLLFGTVMFLLTPFISYGSSTGRFLIYLGFVGGIAIPAALDSSLGHPNPNLDTLRRVAAIHLGLLALSLFVLKGLGVVLTVLLAVGGLVGNAVVPRLFRVGNLLTQTEPAGVPASRGLAP